MDTVMVNSFVVAAVEGSILRAAQRLRYSQSSVTYHIRELEKACSAQLFERRVRGFNLTRDGLAALEISRRLLCTASELQHLRAERHTATTRRLGRTAARS